MYYAVCVGVIQWYTVAHLHILHVFVFKLDCNLVNLHPENFRESVKGELEPGYIENIKSHNIFLSKYLKRNLHFSFNQKHF